ncbi:MAG: polysaccharide deacetylase family protein [Cellulomonas sp.]
MAREISRRMLLGTSVLTAASAAGITFAADVVSTKKSPTDRVPARPETSTTGVGMELIWRAEPVDRLVALTFDDGPDPRWTPLALAALARHDARATFFEMGDFVEQHPGLSRAVRDAGHEIANHGCGHLDLTDLSAAAIHDNLGRAHDAIVAATGIPPTLMRPPYGRIDSLGLFEAASRRYRTVLWSHHLPTDGAQDVVNRNIATASPGMIILCHDGRSTPAESLYVAVGRLLDELTGDGYTFVTVSQLLAARRPAQT